MLGELKKCRNLQLLYVDESDPADVTSTWTEKNGLLPDAIKDSADMWSMKSVSFKIFVNIFLKDIDIWNGS